MVFKATALKQRYATTWHFMNVFTRTYYWYHLQIICIGGIWSCEGEIAHLSFPQDIQPIPLFESEHPAKHAF